MANVTGFLVRSSLSDTGTLPRSGSWTACPDIVPNGIKAMSRNDLIASYGREFNEVLTQGLTNYIYVRAKNMNATPLTQTAWLFQVPGSLVLQPQIWYKATNLVGYDVAHDGTGTPDDPKIIKKYGQVITADSGQIAATEGYTWAPDTTEHHCLVAVVANTWKDVVASCPNYPTNSTNDLANWIYANGSIGWHNVDIKPLPPGVYENQVRYFNTDQKDEYITFTMIAENVPVGARVSFSSNTSTKSGETIGQDWTTVSSPPNGGDINPDFEVGGRIFVDANYQTIITYRTDFAGKPRPSNFKMRVKASVDIVPPAPKNAAMASFLAADSFARSYYRSHSANAIFKDHTGKVAGRGIEGYRNMMAASRAVAGDDDDDGDIGNTKVVVVGSHSTQPSTS